MYLHYWPPVDREPAINVNMVNRLICDAAELKLHPDTLQDLFTRHRVRFTGKPPKPGDICDNEHVSINYFHSWNLALAHRNTKGGCIQNVGTP